MAESYLTLTNKVLARLNEVQLTSSNFSNARGIQIQAQNAVNESVRYINQREFNYPFNHNTATKTLTAGIVRYSLPSSTKTVDYNTFRLVKDSDLGNGGYNLPQLSYNEYVNSVINQEDEIVTNNLNGSLNDSATTITVDSTTGFDSSGTLYIENEQVTYTGTSSTTFTGCTRGANSTTAASHSDDVTVAQFDKGGIPEYVVRTPDNNYLLYPYPNKSFSVKFDYYTYPSDMSAHGDTTTIPDRFAPVIVDGATAFVYQYRGETSQYQLNFERFEQGIKNMQTLLINKFDYLRSTYIPRVGSYNPTNIVSRSL
tara:strand:+ start:14163 stop:15101 length:939 start_codon:yes stop_codon:yes gene_type:complete